MKLKKKFVNALLYLLVFNLIAAQAGTDKVKLGQTRKIVLPSYSILDENAQPIIAPSGKIGFVSSITDGSLISFNTASGKILSSIVVGESVGPITMIENNERRLIAVPAANLPTAGHPATISIIDATKAKQMELRSMLVLPNNAQITPKTQAFLSKDGKFCVIAASFNEPTLYSFSVEKGEMVSQFPLVGQPSETAFFDDGVRRNLAIASVMANNISIVKLDDQGQLITNGQFAPADGRFEDAHNPAFSSDGQSVYIAAANNDKLFNLKTDDASLIDSIAVDAPQRITIAKTPNGTDCIGVTRIRRPINVRSGGATIVTKQENKLTIKSEFNPPEGVEFSNANNVVFNASATSAFMASTTGVLFAFGTETGELESYQVVGNELRRLVISDAGKKVAAVRSNSSGDEIVITSFDMIAPENTDTNHELLPAIKTLKPGTVEEGYANNLRISVEGENFLEGASLIVNGAEIATDYFNSGKELSAALPRSLFKHTGEITVQVKRADETLSTPMMLRVIKPQAPLIDSISPEQMPSPASNFTIKVKGKNFRQSSAIFVEGHKLETTLKNGELQARVSADAARSIKQLSVEVRDVALPELTSNAKTVSIVGPSITEVKPFNDVVVAGDTSFSVKIIGTNFRPNTRVEINGETVPVSLTRRLNEKIIIATVPGRFAHEAKSLAVTVRNAGGDASNAMMLEARAPEIQASTPNEITAGIRGAKVTISGENFRRGAKILVSDGQQQAFKIDRRKVKFISKTQIVVTFTGNLKKLLAKPGVVQVQVVNPNRGDGVDSQVYAIKVSEPQIKAALINPIVGDDSNVRLLIDGSNFRRGAIIEFIKAGAVVRQQAPISIKGNQISVYMQTKKADALGRFAIRVINPGDIRSKATTVRYSEIAANKTE